MFLFLFLLHSLESATQIHTLSCKLEKKSVYFIDEFKVRFVAAILAAMTAGVRGEGCREWDRRVRSYWI